jgi:hypothetical protein
VLVASPKSLRMTPEGRLMRRSNEVIVSAHSFASISCPGESEPTVGAFAAKKKSRHRRQRARGGVLGSIGATCFPSVHCRAPKVLPELRVRCLTRAPQCGQARMRVGPGRMGRVSRRSGTRARGCSLSFPQRCADVLSQSTLGRIRLSMSHSANAPPASPGDGSHAGGSVDSRCTACGVVGVVVAACPRAAACATRRRAQPLEAPSTTRLMIRVRCSRSAAVAVAGASSIAVRGQPPLCSRGA